MICFTCEICEKDSPTTLLNEHHRVPKSLGGTDARNNIAMLDAGCHQNLHALAYMMINPKRQHEVEPTSVAIFPHDPPARKKLLEFAHHVAREMALKKEIKKKPDEEMRTVVELPGLYMELIRLAGYDMPGNTGKPAGVARVIRSTVADMLKQKFPLRREAIEALRKAKK